MGNGVCPLGGRGTDVEEEAPEEPERSGGRGEGVSLKAPGARSSCRSPSTPHASRPPCRPTSWSPLHAAPGAFLEGPKAHTHGSLGSLCPPRLHNSVLPHP